MVIYISYDNQKIPVNAEKIMEWFFDVYCKLNYNINDCRLILSNNI